MGIFSGKKEIVLKSRQLENRSFLKFVFPQGGDSKPVIFDLPFYENIFISETQNANLSRYSPVGRPGELYSHTGAKSRKLNLAFSITLPHIQFDSIALSLNRFLTSVLMETKAEKKARFLSNQNLEEGKNADRGRGDENVTDKVLLNVRNGVTRFFGADAIDDFGLNKQDRETLARGTQRFADENLTGNDFAQSVADTARADADENKSTDKFHSLFSNLTALTVVYWWTNMIRSSVLSNSKNPTLGPPILRLTHGLLYDNIPCVATSYNIEIDEDAGYELKTLTPRKLDFMLTLEEVRVGDLGDFSPGTIVKQDNVAGWEAIFDHGTMDPMRLYGNVYD